jgi:hypothetical protein
MASRLVAAALAAGVSAELVRNFELVPFEGTMPIPTASQLKYQGSISALIHFNMATFVS